MLSTQVYGELDQWTLQKLDGTDSGITRAWLHDGFQPRLYASTDCLRLFRHMLGDLDRDYALSLKEPEALVLVSGLGFTIF